MAILTPQKIRPFLWFDHNALEAAKFYCSLFPNSYIMNRSEMLVEFILDGSQFVALNGGPMFQLDESFSMYVLCEDQREVDRLWGILASEGGSEGQAGWCKDRFGISWQVIPERFAEMVNEGTPSQVRRVTEAMLKMQKMDVVGLEKAYAIPYPLPFAITTLSAPISLLTFPAPSFPAGIRTAFDTMQRQLPAQPPRQVFGISQFQPDNTVKYFAGAEQVEGDQERAGDIPRMTLEPGDYLSLEVRDFQTNPHNIQAAFSRLLHQPGVDKDSYCVEWYDMPRNVVNCLVKLADQ